MLRLFGSLSFALVTIALAASSASARQIVSDPALDGRLVAFEQGFPQYVASHPELTSGAAGPLEVDGRRGKVSIAYSLEGAYTVLYGTLDFAPTSPISPDRFRMSLEITSVVITGSGEIAITRKGETYDLSCPNNVVTVPGMTFTSEVVVTETGAVELDMPRTDLDPRDITLTVPCLAGRGNATAVTDELEARLEDEVAADILAFLSAASGGAPTRGTLKKATAALASGASEPDSDVADTGEDTAETAGRVVATAAASPCGGAVEEDVKAVVGDLAAIANQAEDQGFAEAVAAFADDLRAIVPGLTAPSQDAVETFVDDLEDAVSEDGPGGAEITALEQATLTVELYSIVLSTGITSEDLATLQADLLAAVGSLEGISTAQLEADLSQLVADASACIEDSSQRPECFTQRRSGAACRPLRETRLPSA